MLLAHLLMGCQLQTLQLKSKLNRSFKNSPWLPIALKIIPKLDTRTLKFPCGRPTFPTSSLPICKPGYHTAFWACLKCTKLIPTSGPLHSLFLWPGMPFPQTLSCPDVSCYRMGKGVVSPQMLVPQSGPPQASSLRQPLPTIYL